MFVVSIEQPDFTHAQRVECSFVMGEVWGRADLAGLMARGNRGWPEGNRPLSFAKPVGDRTTPCGIAAFVIDRERMPDGLRSAEIKASR
jgi:hypothetical protein